MKINVDRMARLAGLSKNSSSSSRSLNEGMDHDHTEEMYEDEDMSPIEEMNHEDDIDEDEIDEDEMIEIDEVELVQELRRARKIMMESKNRSSKQTLQEAQLKSIIEEEVKNVFSKMNLNSDWIYGPSKPKRSKPGHSHQGSFLKGLGFK